MTAVHRARLILAAALCLPGAALPAARPEDPQALLSRIQDSLVTGDIPGAAAAAVRLRALLAADPLWDPDGLIRARQLPALEKRIAALRLALSATNLTLQRSSRRLEGARTVDDAAGIGRFLKAEQEAAAQAASELEKISGKIPPGPDRGALMQADLHRQAVRAALQRSQPDLGEAFTPGPCGPLVTDRMEALKRDVISLSEERESLREEVAAARSWRQLEQKLLIEFIGRPPSGLAAAGSPSPPDLETALAHQIRDRLDTIQSLKRQTLVQKLRFMEEMERLRLVNALGVASGSHDLRGRLDALAAAIEAVPTIQGQDVPSMTPAAGRRPRIPRAVLYAAGGFALGASLTTGGYLFDYHQLYGELPGWPSVGLLSGLHRISPVHYFADLLALILAVVAGVAGWLQDRVLFYSSRQEERLRHLTLHDEVTGLPNRMVLTDRLERLLQRRHAAVTRMAVLHVGADRFRRINESLGSAVGDRLLREVARLLALEVSEHGASPPRLESAGTIYRSQGDEFVVVLEEIRSVRDTGVLAERIIQALGRPLHVDGHSVRFSVSVGIAVGGRDGGDAASLLRDAHTAMNRAKQRGGSRQELFDWDMHATAQADLHLETELFRALEEGQLRVWYQPVVNLRSGRLTGFEALVRWEHPDRGVIPPDTFIPLAEESGLIALVSRQAFREAMVQLRRWQETFRDRKDLAIKMNLSPRWLFDDHVEQELDRLLAETGADPSRIHLEITESCLIERPDPVIIALHRLRSRGFRIALDDFGTGYSSLSILHRLPFDMLKLDRSFVSRLPREPAAEAIAGTIIVLARKLGLDVVAEGIETRAQLQKLRALRCGYGQGYLFGRPMDAQDAERLMHASEEGLSQSIAAAR